MAFTTRVTHKGRIHFLLFSRIKRSVRKRKTIKIELTNVIPIKKLSRELFLSKETKTEILWSK
jgi:hypothetical protein